MSPLSLTEPPGYVLRAPPESLDAYRFEQLVSAADGARARGAPAESSTLLAEALGLWRGGALADVADLGSAQPEIARLEELRRRALEDMIDCELELGHHLELVPEIEALVGQHPHSERLRTQLMLALYLGTSGGALDAYQDARRALTDDLGLEPGPELRELHQAILHHDASLLAPEPSVSPTQAKLPSFLTVFVGRENELEEVAALVRGGARLLTVTGLGGMGKTRFTVEAARNLTADFDGNVAYVQLASIADPELVAASIAQALGESGVAAEDALAQHLRSRGRLLLLVDNFEQVLDAAPLLPRLLEAPDLSVLVTSRAPLRVSGEHEYPLPPLQVDEAVTLFADRALGVNPHFTLGDGETNAVEELCARLEGLPLAIELAAARSKLLTPTALLGRLAGRLDLLAEGPRDAPARHRGLRTT